jgi:hypothetical protein
MLFLYGETPLAKYGHRSILLHILLSTASTIYFPQALFIYLLQTNIIFHIIHLILYFQQTVEIDNLMRHGVDGFLPSSWEPQKEGRMSTAANFSLVRNQGLIISRKKPNVRR